MRWLRQRRPSIPAGQRVYAIGDVHGRFDLLSELVRAIERHDRDRAPALTSVVFLGDLVDRGAQSAEVLDFVRSCTKESKIVALKGNHEQIMVDAWRGDMDALAGWVEFGGLATLRSFGVDESSLRRADLDTVLQLTREAISAETIEWLDSLPLIWSLGNYLFVHAGIRPGLPLDRQEPGDLLWIRDDFLDFEGSHGMTVVHGHSVAQTVVFRPNRIGIDTGAYASGRLTALCLEDIAAVALQTGADAPVTPDLNP